MKSNAIAHTKKFCSPYHRCTTLYLEKYRLHDHYGFIKDVRQEKIEDFMTINAISSADNETSDVELDQINTQLSEILRGIELRKRAYFVNLPANVFIIGGYLFDPLKKERRVPTNDWRWDIAEKKLEKIQPIPGGRINFGLAANNGKVIVIGGNTISNQPTAMCYLYGMNEDQWELLPKLPNPLCGSAVTIDDNDSIYVLGGYDLMSGESHFCNDFLRLDELRSKEWTQLKNTIVINRIKQAISPRARTLLVACAKDVIPPSGGLFACGGYHRDGGELQPVPEIICYNNKKEMWTFLSTIPNLKKIDIFAVDNNVLVISSKVPQHKSNAETGLVPHAKYDLIQRKWTMVDGKDIKDERHGERVENIASRDTQENEST